MEDVVELVYMEYPLVLDDEKDQRRKPRHGDSGARRGGLVAAEILGGGIVVEAL